MGQGIDRCIVTDLYVDACVEAMQAKKVAQGYYAFIGMGKFGNAINLITS